MSNGFFISNFVSFFQKLKDIKIGNGSELTKRQKILKKTLWFFSISRNAIVVLISCQVAILFESYGESPFILSGMSSIFMSQAIRNNMLLFSFKGKYHQDSRLFNSQHFQLKSTTLLTHSPICATKSALASLFFLWWQF